MSDDDNQTVFVYGADLDPARLRARCPSVRGRRGAVLRDHRLVFDRVAIERDGTGYPNVVRAPGEMVEGALVVVARDDLEYRLDRFEGHPRHCSRRLLAVEAVDGERVPAWVYLANPDARAGGLRPRADHVAHLLAGADLLSDDYRRRVAALAAAGSAPDV